MTKNKKITGATSMKHRFILLIIFCCIFSQTYSQNGKEERKQLRAGNKEYRAEKYTESEILYRKALEADAQSTNAAYNLGNAMYKQKKFQEAVEQYQVVLGKTKDKKMLSETFHNVGNIFMEGKEYAKSISAYKQALKNNPKDDETRYNLALAQKLLKDQENQNEQNQDKDKDKDKQDQKDQQDKQDKQDQNKDQKQDQKEDQKDQQQQQQNEKMSKESAQQILDAMLQDEKNTQEKVHELQKKQQQRKKTEKEW